MGGGVSSIHLARRPGIREPSGRSPPHKALTEVFAHSYSAFCPTTFFKMVSHRASKGLVLFHYTPSFACGTSLGNRPSGKLHEQGEQDKELN